MQQVSIQQSSPLFRCLSQDQVRGIHQAVLEVLEETGTEVYDQEAIDLLQRAGARVKGTRVYLPGPLVEWAIEKAPARISVSDRDGNPALDLTGRNTYFGPGPSCPYTLDVRTGERRLVQRQDIAEYAGLCEGLPNIDFVMSMGIISDCPPEVSDVEEFAAMIRFTKKPVVAWAWTETGARDILALALAYRRDLQDLQERPYYIFYTEPSAPLRHTREALQKLLLAAEHGLPVIYGAGPVGGASSPVTIEGMIAVGAAEVLAGLVIAQLKRPGSPFIFGTGTGPIDMSTMIVAYGAPEFILGQAALCDLARFYEIPGWGFGGCSDSKIPDEQAAIQSALWNLMSGLAGANLIHDVGFLESGMTGSMEAIVMNDEIIGSVKRLLGGAAVRERCSGISDFSPYERWLEQGRLTMGERARAKALEIIQHAGPLADGRDDYIQEILQKARSRLGSGE